MVIDSGSDRGVGVDLGAVKFGGEEGGGGSGSRGLQYRVQTAARNTTRSPKERNSGSHHQQC